MPRDLTAAEELRAAITSRAEHTPTPELALALCDVVQAFFGADADPAGIALTLRHRGCTAREAERVADLWAHLTRGAT